MKPLVIVALVMVVAGYVHASTPYTPTAGWTYYLEAVRENAWPSCQYRFLSHPDACGNAVGADLWMGAGINQQWTLVSAGNGNFYLRADCGYYLSYSGDCNSHVINSWSQAGVNQEFKFVTGNNDQPGQYYIQAVGRSSCSYNWMSFPGPCTTNQPDTVDLWSGAGVDQRFRLHPVRSQSPYALPTASSSGCADPFAWTDPSSNNCDLVCTGGLLSFMTTSSPLTTSSVFTYKGQSLGGSQPGWISQNSRWAPENFVVKNHTVQDEGNIIFVCDSQLDGKHRIGYVWSTTGAKVGAWTDYSANYMQLSGASGGDIDPHVFQDPTSGRQYLFWKSDDNSMGSSTTRIWAQELLINATTRTVKQLDSPRVVMDSAGLWWIDSWVAGGSLVEGPEVVYHGGYYYLFFASGKYCQDSYAEGVARSKSVYGPYEKLGVPLLNTGMVGNSGGTKIIGPGHASFVQNSGEDYLMTVWHASIGENCNRYPFITKTTFTGVNGWPVTDW